jgi:HPt (histidine-containing phosphotransfer) domain-containing protein
MNTIPFQFDRRIDEGSLYSLYENDYPFIEEIFRTTLKHYDEDVEMLIAHYVAGNLEDLKKSMHKLKPVFGFIGMPLLQESCNDFENKCSNATGIKEIAEDYERLLYQFNECKEIIQADLQKLSAYNKNAE